MNNTYTFIFEIQTRDSSTGLYKPMEYRKYHDMTITQARAYMRRISNLINVTSVKFYKEMI